LISVDFFLNLQFLSLSGDKKQGFSRALRDRASVLLRIRAQVTDL